jgi:hypothetical protein
MRSSSALVQAFDASRYPRAYEPSFGNRVIWISFGGLLVGFGGALSWLLWRNPDQLGPKGPLVITGISLTLVLLGGYLILSMLFSKVILRPDAVEVRNLLSHKTLLRHDIAGRRFAPATATIELIPLDNGKEKFKVAVFTKPDALFTAWFESIPNLDAGDLMKTHAERPHAYRQEARKVAGKALGMSFVGLVGILIGAHLYPPLDMAPVIVLGIVLFFAPYFTFMKRFSPNVALKRRVWYSAGAGLLIVTALLFLNGALDKKPPEQVRTRVLRKYFNQGRGGPNYSLTVSSWRSGHGEESLDVNRATFSMIQTGELVVVAVHRGALGLSWYSEVVPAS